MNAALHLWNLLRARLGRRRHNRLALQKRQLETLLRQSGISKAESRKITWRYFNESNP